MKKTLIVIGGIGLGIALIVTLFSVFLVLNAPAKGKTFEYVATVDVPLETLSTPASTSAVPTETPAQTVSSKEHILEQIRQLAAEYEQAVQAEKQHGKVEFSQDPSTGEELFRFTDESYQRISELYWEFMEQQTQLEQLYTQIYRDETRPTPFPTSAAADGSQAHYELLMQQAEEYCSLESWQRDVQAESISVYDPDNGQYRPVFIGDSIARCEIYGQMLEEFRVAPVLEKVDQDHDLTLIRQVMGKPDLQLSFRSIQPLANAVGRSAAVYTDETGAQYYVDVESGRLAAIDPHFVTHPEIPSDQVKSMDQLREVGRQFASTNSPRLAELESVLLFGEGCKGAAQESICFFRWDARNMEIDWSDTDWAMMPPFLQVGVLMDGTIVVYNNTLDLFESTAPVIPPQPTPQAILGGGSVRDGPFTFVLYLFHDPSLGRQVVTPSLYSEMESVGAYLYWFYEGPETIGPVETSWGTLPQLDQLLQATYSSISIGSSGGRTGGVMLPGGSFIPGESKPGDRVQIALKVIAPGEEYGAALAFSLEQGANSLQPADISIEVLPHE